MTGSKFVPSIKNTVREICISSCEGKYPVRGKWKVVRFQIPKGTFVSVVGNILNSVNVRGIFPGTYKRTELASTVIRSAMKWISFFAVQVNKCNISRANFSFSFHE